MVNPLSKETKEFAAQEGPDDRVPGRLRSAVRMEFGAVSHPGCVRPTNEDHYVVVRRSPARSVLATNLPVEALVSPDEEDAYILAVADGVGGTAFGDLASLLALRTAWDLGGHDASWPLKVNETTAQEILERFEAYAKLIHSTLREKGREERCLAGMGTTLTVAYTVGLDAFVGHIGDSRAYLFRQGKLEQLTRDHTLAQQLVDAGVLSPGAFELRRLRHVLVNCLGGTEDSVRVDSHHLKLQGGDWLLLCSDGLTHMVTNDSICCTLDRVPRPQDACQALLDQALKAGGRDNVTVVLARYDTAGG
jgi:protein phosphatase